MGGITYPLLGLRSVKLASSDDRKRLKDSNDGVGCFCETEVFYHITSHELAIVKSISDGNFQKRLTAETDSWTTIEGEKPPFRVYLVMV